MFSIESVMSKDLVTILPGGSLAGGQFKGIITDTDFVAIAINLLELLEETEPVDQQYA